MTHFLCYQHTINTKNIFFIVKELLTVKTLILLLYLITVKDIFN